MGTGETTAVSFRGSSSAEAAPIRVLVVEDERTLRDSCTSVLSHDGYDVVSCGRGDEARNLLQRRKFDIVLVDLNMTQVNGMELLRVCRDASPETLVLVMTGNPDVNSSIEALRAGAWEYLPKPFTAVHLQILLGRGRHAILSGQRPPKIEEQGSQERKVEAAQTAAPALLGRSPIFLHTLRLVERVARTDASVFLTGESGSGKEVIAQAIHSQSRRNRNPIVAINCAALPETLLESEMFGHVKGAFTGAIRNKPGLLETADGGTMFLDELTEMSQPIQAKLLRVIQDGVVRRVGSESTDATVNVRFIAATNRDPREATEEGILRKDLYYRLSVVPIRVPALRERTEDIPLLAEHFLSLYWKRHRENGSPLPRFSSGAMRDLQARPWRGNVRELQNVMEHAVVLLDPGCEIQQGDLPHIDDPSAPVADASAPTGWRYHPDVTEAEYHVARERVLRDFEFNYISHLVDRTGANMSKAARLADIDRTTLYRLMEKHDLHRTMVVQKPVLRPGG